LGTHYTWDGEGKQISANGASYVYYADGERAGKSGGSATATDYVNFNGEPVARLSGGVWTDLVYGANGLLAEVTGSGGAPNYRFTDQLGSSVGLALSSGGSLSIQDYAPFGELFNGNSDSDPYKFTGKERDAESGNDYFGARYYASSMGRFMSPDDGSDQNALDPASWNLYSYVANNPLNATDPDGHSIQICTTMNGTQHCTDGIDDDAYKAAQQSKSNGGLTGPSLADLQNSATGSGVIKDSSGNVVGTVQWTPDNSGIQGSQAIQAFGQIGNQGMGAIKWFGEQMAWNVAGGFAAHGIGLGVEALQASRAAALARAAEAAADAEKITNGHAFLKHAGEFGNITKNEFKDLVQETISNPSDARSLANGRTAYWNESEQMVVIKNPNAADGGTAFRPTAGKSYFDNLR
jgi:RHS repeat-associated protein